MYYNVTQVVPHYHSIYDLNSSHNQYTNHLQSIIDHQNQYITSQTQQLHSLQQRQHQIQQLQIEKQIAMGQQPNHQSHKQTQYHNQSHHHNQTFNTSHSQHLSQQQIDQYQQVIQKQQQLINLQQSKIKKHKKQKIILHNHNQQKNMLFNKIKSKIDQIEDDIDQITYLNQIELKPKVQRNQLNNHPTNNHARTNTSKQPKKCMVEKQKRKMKDRMEQAIQRLKIGIKEAEDRWK